MTSTRLLKAGRDNEGGCPSITIEDLVAQMQADRAARVHCFFWFSFVLFFYHQKVTDIDCVQSDKKKKKTGSTNKRSGSSGVKGKEC